jgi:hypothetical protein
MQTRSLAAVVRDTMQTYITPAMSVRVVSPPATPPPPPIGPPTGLTTPGPVTPGGAAPPTVTPIRRR